MSIWKSTNRKSAGEQLKDLGVALNILDAPEPVKDEQGRVIDTNAKKPKLNVKSKKVYKKKLKQNSASPKDTGFLEMFQEYTGIGKN